MKTLTINVGGKEVPCRLSMGAMLLFKQNTGKDVSEMKTDDMEDLLMFMWCCVVCACKADGVEFGIDFETFTCMITPQDVSEWNEAMASENDKKKESGQP